MYVRNETPLKSASHTVFKTGKLFRRQIAGDNNLFVVVMKGVEGVEKSLLRGIFTLQKLDIVDQ